jgi:hypothetical protein
MIAPITALSATAPQSSTVRRVARPRSSQRSTATAPEASRGGSSPAR